MNDFSPAPATPAVPEDAPVPALPGRVGVLLVAHGKLGRYFLDVAEDLIGTPPLPVDVLEVRRVLAHEGLLSQGERLVARLDEGQGVLLLTDAYGSTPSNIANKLSARAPGATAVVAGLNLPMLLRIFNYARRDLSGLVQTALEGGQKGIVLCPEAESGSAD